MTCILIDDEPDCLELLALMIGKHCPGLTIAGQYDQPQEGIEAIWEKRPELVFLDVDMPGINGFGVLDACKAIPFQVIFTTAYQEYAVKAFRYSATGYLLKPIDRIELMEVMDKAKLMRTVQQIDQQRDILFDYLGLANKQKIALPSHEGIHFITVTDIVYCAASGNYSELYLNDDTKMVFTTPLKELETMLEDSHFVRSHNSYLVNVKKVKMFSKGDGGELTMSNGKIVPVSRGKRDLMLKLLGIS